MWNKQNFEKKIEEGLKQQFGTDDGEKYFQYYVNARTYLIDHVYGEIKGKEPAYSDHGSRHIAHVLKNIDHLLLNSHSQLDGINLYCLGLIVLFHDVGNIKGRKNHNKNIGEVYNAVRERKPEFNQERNVVIRAAEAHTGFNSKDGSTDTLKKVSKVDSLFGYKVKLQELAALLRLADECAEGPQRTSDYLLQTGDIVEDSIIHHEYATITEVFVDRGGERIALTYNVDVTKEKMEDGSFEKLMTYAYKRISKLDIERRYCKYYSELLFPFKNTEAVFNFSIDGIPCDVYTAKIILGDQYPIPLNEAELELKPIEDQIGVNSLAELKELLVKQFKQ